MTMETVPEEEFANLENVVSTVEVVRQDEPSLQRVEKFDTVASCIDQRPMHENLPNLLSCCLVFDQRIGISCWIFFEAILWFILTIAGFYNGAKYIHAHDMYDFLDMMETSWYSLLVYGDEVYYVDNQMRSLYIMFNLVLIMIYATYCICCILALFGVATYKIGLIFPLMIMDLIFMTLAFGGCVAGIVTGRLTGLHVFQISFFFLLIKLTTEIHILSFVRNIIVKRSLCDEMSQATCSDLQRTTTAV